MALKTKKKAETTTAVAEVVNEEVVETVAEETAEPILTEDEKDAIKKAEEKKEKEGASTERLRLATQVVSNQFNLDPSYKVCQFNDKGKVVVLALENSEFNIVVTIKDSDRQGMHISE